MTEEEIEQDRNCHYDLQCSKCCAAQIHVSACLAENPDWLTTENAGFSARNARRMTSH
jgi:hypothetical protein